MKNKKIRKIKTYPSIIFLLLLSTLLCTLAYMTDKSDAKINLSTATFSADAYNYSLSRSLSDEPSIAGEDIKVEITERYTLPSDSPSTESIIRMGVTWNSPDTSASLFENQKKEDNLRIQMDGQDIKYTQDAKTGKFLFDLPAHKLIGSEQTRELVVHIPESLYSTGDLEFSFEKVIIQQSNGGFSDSFDQTELNANETLDFIKKVGWAASADSANNGKSLMGYLFVPNDSKPSEFGINFDFEFGSTFSGMKNFSSKDDAKWSHYAGSVVELSFEDNILTIGDYAFPDFEKITEVNLPENLISIGAYAFDNTAIEHITLPESVNLLEPMSFGHSDELNEIAFEGSYNKTIAFPDKAGKETGAFYVASNTVTTIHGINESIFKYDWKSDNRAVLFADIKGIEVSAKPKKTEYMEGEDFNKTGMVISLVFSNGDKVSVSDYTIIDANNLSGNKTSVTVSYKAGEKVYTADVPITVISDAVAPTLTVSNPASADSNNPTVLTSNNATADGKLTYTVSGTATDDSAITSLTVNGVEATLNALTGAWSIDIELTVGEGKTIEVVATDKAGKTTTVTRYVLYDYTDFTVSSSNRSTLPGYSDTAVDYSIPETFYSSTDKTWYKTVAVGGWAFQNCSSLDGTFTIPDSVTSIGQYAFSGCSGLDAIDLGEGVESIGMYAFNQCSSLNGTLTIPDSVKTIGEGVFQSCSGLDKLDLGDSVVTIGNYAFRYCTELDGTLTIPDSTTSIGSDAFYGCSGLDALVIGEKVQTIGNGVFQNCSSLDGTLTIPDTVTSIGMYAFNGCSSLDALDLGNGLETIGNYAFQNCSSLAGTLTIPDSVTSIGNIAFAGCSGVTAVDLGEGVVSIGDSAFSNCSLTGTLTIPDSVKSIGGYAFRGSRTTTLTAVEFGEGLETIGYGAFSECMGLDGTLTIPDSVKSIGGEAFKLCNSLDALDLGEGVESIGDSAFQNCSSLDGTLTIPDSVTSIGSNTFAYCRNLDSVVVGNKVQTIGSGAFNECSGFTSITLPASVTSIGTGAFPTPSSGYWYNSETGEAFAPADIPIQTAATYVSVAPVIAPTIKAQDSWYEGCSVTVDKITKIAFKTSGAPSSYNEAWAVDVDSTGSIMAYRSGATITIVGNGAPKIMANADSSDMFNGWSVDSSTNGEQFTSLTTIEGLSLLDTSNVTNMSGMFEETGSLTGTVDLSSWDTSKVTDMSSMFRYSGLSGLITPDGFGSACTTMKNMFSECTRLQSMDVRHWDTKNVENMHAIFDACTSLTSINMSGLDTSSLTTAKSFAYGCTNLKTVDLSGWDTSKITITYRMFYKDAALVSVDLRGWDVTSVDGTSSSGGADMFRQCYPDTPFTLTVSSEAMKTWVQNTKNFTLAKYVNIVVDTNPLNLDN